MKLIRVYLILHALLGCNYAAHSQAIDDIIPSIEREPVIISDTLGRHYDTKEIETRHFKKNLRETYNNPEFNYNRVARVNNQNFFSRFVSWVIEGLSNIFGFTFSPLTVQIITYIFYAIIGAVAIYFIIRFVGSEGFSKILNKGVKPNGSVAIEDTHIEELDLEALIKESLTSGNYRNALRYQYLNLLKSLSKKDLIEWDFQKTNADYYRELKNLQIKAQFLDVSRIYDYVWYGEFPIDQPRYDAAMKQFNSLTNTAI